MALTITSTEDHYFVDGPLTNESATLNEFLLALVDLDRLPPGEYTFSVVDGVFTLDPPLPEENWLSRLIRLF